MDKFGKNDVRWVTMNAGSNPHKAIATGVYVESEMGKREPLEIMLVPPTPTADIPYITFARKANKGGDHYNTASNLFANLHREDMEALKKAIDIILE